MISNTDLKCYSEGERGGREWWTKGLEGIRGQRVDGGAWLAIDIQ